LGVHQIANEQNEIIYIGYAGGRSLWGLRGALQDKLAATEAGGRVVDRAMQIHGGYGVTKEFPFERWYREMRIRRIGEGPNEVQRLIIARDLIGGAFH
jgi:alkylation response protein AidB-like acyl-CoA dehydrogenase